MILVGIPGAGKTTLCGEKFPTHECISKDAMPNVRDKQGRQAALLRAALGAGRSVVVDNTNVTPAERGAIIGLAREFGARVIGYYLETATRDAVARNERREGKARVPKVAIFMSAKRLVPPALDEGFDELHTIGSAGTQS